MDQVETAKYLITGLVDIFDEQGQITGQFPIGSVQELPVEVGDKAVEAGTAELAGAEGDEETVGEVEEETAGEEEVAGDDTATGETGESEEESEEGEDNEEEVI